MLRVPNCSSPDIQDFRVFPASVMCVLHRCYSLPFTFQASCSSLDMKDSSRARAEVNADEAGWNGLDRTSGKAWEEELAVDEVRASFSCLDKIRENISLKTTRSFPRSLFIIQDDVYVESLQ